MDSLLQFKSSKWRKLGIEKIESKYKKNKITGSHIMRAAIDFFILEYRGKYDRFTFNELDFEARKKVEKMISDII